MSDKGILYYECGHNNEAIPVFADEVDKESNRHQWISVLDKCPSTEHHVMVYRPRAAKPIIVDRLGDAGGIRQWFASRGEQYKVTHWQPLPEPPGGEGE